MLIWWCLWQFVEKALVLTLSFALSEQELGRRGGALMALYALFNLQPTAAKCLVHPLPLPLSITLVSLGSRSR